MGEQPEWMALADAVEALMRRRGWKKANYAQAAGVAPGSVTRLLNRTYSPERGPDAETIEKYLSAFRPQDADLLKQHGLDDWADRVGDGNGLTRSMADYIEAIEGTLSEFLDDEAAQEFKRRARALRSRLGLE